jgi:hypothetical protein
MDKLATDRHPAKFALFLILTAAIFLAVPLMPSHADDHLQSTSKKSRTEKSDGNSVQHFMKRHVLAAYLSILSDLETKNFHEAGKQATVLYDASRMKENSFLFGAELSQQTWLMYMKFNSQVSHVIKLIEAMQNHPSDNLEMAIHYQTLKIGAECYSCHVSVGLDIHIPTDLK